MKVDWQGVRETRRSTHSHFRRRAPKGRDSRAHSAATTIDSGYGELQSAFGDSFFDTLSLRMTTTTGSAASDLSHSAVYLIKDTGTKLKASLGTGLQSADSGGAVRELAGVRLLRDPNLRPESSTGGDVGFEQAALDTHLSFGVTYFRNNIKNLITDNADFTSYANVGRAMTQGVESFIAYQPIKTLHYDSTTPIPKRPTKFFTRSCCAGRSTSHVDGNWQATQRLSLNATVLAVSSWIDGNRDFSIPRLDAPGYTTVNLATSFDVDSKLTVFGRIDNLFDRHYENPVGYLQPSLGAFAGVKIRL